ncbi:MAG TPA: hypothetical protein VF945_12595, partial [Polyangia bacterium]
QISSAISITLQGDNLTGGGINAGGGGGRAGCATSVPNGPSSGANPGGGGSGGMIFLEAPAITLQMNTTLSANGGAGGGETQAGTDGPFGLSTSTAARGGNGTNAGEFGGNGAFSADGLNLTPATLPNPATDNGGGGGVGRIWLRTRNTPATTGGAMLSPGAKADTTL